MIVSNAPVSSCIFLWCLLASSLAWSETKYGNVMLILIQPLSIGEKNDIAETVNDFREGSKKLRF